MTVETKHLSRMQKELHNLSVDQLPATGELPSAANLRLALSLSLIVVAILLAIIILQGNG